MAAYKPRDVVMAKLAVIAFVFIVVNLWDGLANWIQTTSVWWFVAAFIIFGVLAGGCRKCCGGMGERKMMKPARKRARKKK